MKIINLPEADICIISPSLLETGTNRGGGAEVTDYNVALQLSKRFRISILSPFHQKYRRSIRVNNNFSIIEVPFPAQKNYPNGSIAESYLNTILIYLYSFCSAFLTYKLARNGLKVLIVHNPQTALPSIFIAKLLGIKLIYSEGNISPWIKPYIATPKSLLLRKYDSLNFYLTKIICKYSDRIRAQSISIRAGMIKSGVDYHKIRVISTGIDSNEFRPLYTKSAVGRIRIGFIGRLTEIKGAPLLFDVVNACVREIPNARFFIFGEGPYKSQLQAMPNIEHLGMVPRNELNQWLSQVDLVLFFQTELGRAEVEAMAAGKAVVACNLGEMPQIITHLVDGFLCEPNSGSYVNAISYLSQNRDLIEELGKNAQKMVTSHFNWESVGIKWESLCKEII